MPIIKSSSDLQRNFAAINELAHETREPIYITRNGESSLVVMDVEAFEELLELQKEVYEYEMQLLERLIRSEEESALGHEMSYEDYRQHRAAAHVSETVA